MSDHDRLDRKLDRLRDELADDGVALPCIPETERLQLDELEYARRPQSHEGVSPTYGALVSTTPWDRQPFAEASTRLGIASDLAVGRRLADGRFSFLVRTVEAEPGVICLPSSLASEASVVRACGPTTVAVQRSASGLVRLTGPEAIVTWHAGRWWTKPRSPVLARTIESRMLSARADVIDGLMEFAVHWLSARRIGATIVYQAGDSVDNPYLGTASALSIPPISIMSRSTFPALVHVLGQFDRAAIVNADGIVDTVAVALRSSRQSMQSIGPFHGTRHTAARRFSADAREAVVVVVSSGGPVSVFIQGEVVVTTQPATTP